MSSYKKWDPIIEEIIEELAEEFDLPYRKVRACVSHFFKWQYWAFYKAEYACFLWDKFGSFTYFNRPDSSLFYPEAIQYYNSTKKKDRLKLHIPENRKKGQKGDPIVTNYVYKQKQQENGVQKDTDHDKN